MSNFELVKAQLVAADPDRFLAFQLINNELHCLYEHNGYQEVLILSEEECNNLVTTFN